MLSIDVAKDWVGLEDGADTTVLQLITDGVVDYVRQATNLPLFTPPVAWEQLLDCRGPVEGGLSLIGQTDYQRFPLYAEPVRLLTGQFAVAQDDTAVTGTASMLTRQLSVVGKTPVRIAGEWSRVSSITDDEAMVIDTAHTAGATDEEIEIGMISVESRASAGKAWYVEDPQLFEISGRSLYTTTRAIPQGLRTLRVRYLVGYDANRQPADIVLLMLRMIQFLWKSKKRTATSVSLDGAIRVTWGDFGKQAESFKRQADDLRGPVGFIGNTGRQLHGDQGEWPA